MAKKQREHYLRNGGVKWVGIRKLRKQKRKRRKENISSKKPKTNCEN